MSVVLIGLGYLSATLFYFLHPHRMSLMLWLLFTCVVSYFIICSIVRLKQLKLKDFGTSIHTKYANEKIDIEAKFLNIPTWLFGDITVRVFYRINESSNVEEKLFHITKHSEQLTFVLDRGQYDFFQIECVATDIFNCFRFNKVLDCSLRFDVLPPKGTASFFPQRILPTVTESSHIRDYQIGDTVSRIHWRASAKTGSLKTKQYIEEKSTPIEWISVHCFQSYYKNDKEFEELLSTIMYQASIHTHFGFIFIGKEKKMFHPQDTKSLFRHLACVQLE